jgi:hypothetical protein
VRAAFSEHCLINDGKCNERPPRLSIRCDSGREPGRCFISLIRRNEMKRFDIAALQGSLQSAEAWKGRMAA